MTWQPDQPYNDLPLLPPKFDLDSVAILKACIPARVALAELKKTGELLPNQRVLINLLPLLEAKNSSEVENILITTDQLFQFAHEDGLADAKTKEVLRYRSALHRGSQELANKPLSGKIVMEICSTIKGIQMNVRKIPRITLANPLTGKVIYTPPSGENHIRDLLANWQAFLHQDDEIDPLVKMAIAHYQFEAIHPFLDGNGRTARVLNILYLTGSGLLSLPILQLSRFILQNKQDYYHLLHEVTKNGDWQGWILYILKAVEQTATWTTQKITAVRQLIEHTTEFIKTNLPKIYSHELVQAIFEQPCCRITNLVEQNIAKRQTASVYLKQLCEIGVLQEITTGKEKLFIHSKLIQLITEGKHEFDYYLAKQ